MRPRSVFLAAACGAVLIATAASAAPNDPLRIIDLRVEGGAEAWHSVNTFRLDWKRPQDGAPASAVHFQVRNSAETIVLNDRFEGEERVIEQIHLPGPGIYRAEVWLEGAGGEMGSISAAALRFDNVAPGPVSPIGPGGWVGGGSPAIVRIAHPPSPLPVSGLRGYAISVDQGAGEGPCRDPARCTLTETDLHGGIDDDVVALTGLPDGTSFVRVVAVSDSGMRSRIVQSTALRVDATPPEVELRGLPDGWADHPVRLTAVAGDALSGMDGDGAEGPYTAIAVDDQAPTIAAGSSATATVRGEGTHQVAYYARDAAGSAADGEAGAPSPARAVVGIDEAPPRVAFARAQDPSEPERIEAIVSDDRSGPNPIRGTIAIRPAGSRQRFEALPTTASRGRLVARWDSDRYPHGTYEFRATGYDAAGNSAAADRRLGGARMVLPNPIKQPVELVSGFGGRRLVWQRCSRRATARRCRRETIGDLERRPAARTVPYGRGTAFSGRLATDSGAVLGGLPVTVTETFAAGSEPDRRETAARTRPDGSFLVHLAPGPSRRVEASFQGTHTLTEASGPPADFAVLSSVRLRTSTATARVGGAPVVFSGRLGRLGGSIPAGGIPVELQFRLPGSDWSEFRTLQAGADGRFRYRYAFSDDDSRGAHFQFRAYVPAAPGWPYEPAVSRPVFVTGR